MFSIARDTDGKLFETTAAKLPWKNNYCDLKGFDGENFRNYLIVGTPTLFIIDKKGVIVAQLSNSDDFETWMKKLN